MGASHAGRLRRSTAVAGEGWPMFARRRQQESVQSRWPGILVHLANIRPALVLPVQDGFLLSAAAALVLLFRYDGEVAPYAWEGLLDFLPIATILFVGVNAVAGVYGQLWRYASIIEAR